MKPLLTLLLISLPSVPAEEPKGGKQTEADLVLVAELKSAKTIQPGERIGISLALNNTSKSATYHVIQTGEGSSVGWRQPHVYFSVQHLGADGTWTGAPAKSYGRCGVFDADWTKDFADLAPGASLGLKDWFSAVSDRYEFQEPGEYRVRAHYDYGIGVRTNPTQLPIAVREIPPFKIVSEPIRITLERPLEVKLRAKRHMAAKEEVRLSDLFELTLGNVSSEEADVSSPTLSADARIGFEIEAEFNGWRPLANRQSDPNGIKRTIKPKEALPLLGGDEFANGIDGTWIYPAAETVKVRASYTRSTWKPSSTIKSDWVEVVVMPDP